MKKKNQLKGVKEMIITGSLEETKGILESLAIKLDGLKRDQRYYQIKRLDIKERKYVDRLLPEIERQIKCTEDSIKEYKGHVERLKVKGGKLVDYKNSIGYRGKIKDLDISELIAE